jgi:hypothetical protein
MKQFIPEESGIEAVSALERLLRKPTVGGYPAHIGLGVHKESMREQWPKRLERLLNPWGNRQKIQGDHQTGGAIESRVWR